MTTPPEPLHPGRILFEQAMTPLNVSRNKLARDIDVPVGRISDIVSGKRGVTPDTALRLAKYFGTSAELWLRLQSEFDLHVARTRTWPKTEPRVRAFEEVEGGATHSLPGERPLAPKNSPPPAPVAEAAQPVAEVAQPVVAEPSPAPPIFAAPQPEAEALPEAAALGAAPEAPAPPPAQAELQLSPAPAVAEALPAASGDIPPLRAIRLDAEPSTPLAETAKALIPGRPAARLGEPAAAAPQVGAPIPLDESLEIPEPEDPFLLDTSFEIKSD